MGAGDSVCARMIWVYLSLPVFLALPLFVLDAAGISRLGQTFALATVAAAAIHLLLPTEIGWPRPTAVPGYSNLRSFPLPLTGHTTSCRLCNRYGALAFIAIWVRTPTVVD